MRPGRCQRLVPANFDVVAIVDGICFRDLAAVSVEGLVPGGRDAGFFHGDRTVDLGLRSGFRGFLGLTLVPGMGRDSISIESVGFARTFAAVGLNDV